jgi:hypothetical protein
MTMCSAARLIRPALAAFSLAFVLAAAGCGANVATLTGTIKYKGEPLPSGSVLVYGADNQPVIGVINEGTYTVEKAPVGDVKIAVQVQDPKSMPGAGGKGPGGGMGVPGGGGGAPKDAMKGVPGQGEQANIPSTTPGAVKVVPIPPKYAKPETSGISTTLKKGKNEFAINLD